MNRVTDLDEDLANGVQGTERVARRKRAVTVASFALLVTGAIGVLGGLMLAAPIGQRVLHPSRADRGLTSADCIWPTHVGTLELTLYLVGAACGSAAGLPANVYLR